MQYHHSPHTRIHPSFKTFSQLDPDEQFSDTERWDYVRCYNSIWKIDKLVLLDKWANRHRKVRTGYHTKNLFILLMINQANRNPTKPYGF